MLEPAQGLAPRSLTYEASASLPMLHGHGFPEWNRTTVAEFRKLCTGSTGREFVIWCRWLDSNQLPRSYQERTSPAMLPRHGTRRGTRTRFSSMASSYVTINTCLALVPPEGFAPSSQRLRAACSAVELRRHWWRRLLESHQRYAGCSRAHICSAKTPIWGGRWVTLPVGAGSQPFPRLTPDHHCLVLRRGIAPRTPAL